MDQFFQNEFSEVLKLVHEKNIPMLEAEKQVCGYDHAEFAGRIAEEWKYPEYLTTSLRNHHNADYTGDHAEIAHVIYLANCLEYSFNEEHQAIDPPEADPAMIAEFIEDDEQLDILKVKFEAETERNQAILKLFQ
jgi:HD-like signal output (HDOD) protein